MSHDQKPALEILRIGIRYFIRLFGWKRVVQVVKEERPNEKRPKRDEPS